MKKPAQDHSINVRVDEKTWKKLEKKGKEKSGAKPTSYARHLILTHPEMKGD